MRLCQQPPEPRLRPAREPSLTVLAYHHLFADMTFSVSWYTLLKELTSFRTGAGIHE